MTRFDPGHIRAVIRASHSQAAAARQLGVTPGTISRWLRRHNGPLAVLARPVGGEDSALAPAADGLDARTWARGVRVAYELNANEAAALRVAEDMLGVALDAGRPVAERVQAAKTWQSLVKSLHLEVSADGEVAPAYPRRA